MIKLINKKITDDYSKSHGSVNVFLNPYSYLVMRKNRELLSYIDNIYIDGEWLCKFLRYFGVANVTRCSFDNTSFAPIFFKSLSIDQSIGVIGSDQDSNDEFCDWIELNYPKVNVNFRNDGYFNDEKDRYKLIQEILNSNVDNLICGMGTPLQEEFITKLKDKGWKGTAFTCGGFIHQTAKKGSNYYPNWVNYYNLRFLFRIWDEPKLLKRYVFDYPKFVIIYFLDLYLNVD
ncbi:WecB/TagA/CpsF family glycosyltransferase [Vibrio lentus]